MTTDDHLDPTLGLRAPITLEEALGRIAVLEQRNTRLGHLRLLATNRLDRVAEQIRSLGQEPVE